MAAIIISCADNVLGAWCLGLLCMGWPDMQLVRATSILYAAWHAQSLLASGASDWTVVAKFACLHMAYACGTCISGWHSLKASSLRMTQRKKPRAKMT
jgi:hypothetical protein